MAVVTFGPPIMPTGNLMLTPQLISVFVFRTTWETKPFSHNIRTTRTIRIAIGKMAVAAVTSWFFRWSGMAAG